MDCIERLSIAIMEAERLIFEKSRDEAYVPSSYKEIIDGDKEKTPRIEVTRIQGTPACHISHDGKANNAGPTEALIRTQTVGHSYNQKTVAWKDAVISNIDPKYEEFIEKIQSHKIRSKVAEGSGQNIRFEYGIAEHCLDEPILNSDEKKNGLDAATVLFDAEAKRKLFAIEKLIKSNNELITEKTKKREAIEGTFKSLLKNRSTIKQELSEVSGTLSDISALSNAEKKQSLAKKLITGPGALEMVVNSEAFRKYLDRQIVSSISRVPGFKKHYETILESEDIARIVRIHAKVVFRSIAKLIEEKDRITNTKDYRDLAECMVSINEASENGNFQTEVGVQLARYQNILETIIGKINKGNFECDCRFIKMISRTISKLGAYDDPVVTKMTVQFVVCKRYVEDYIEIKKAIKEFTGCDL